VVKGIEDGKFHGVASSEMRKVTHLVKFLNVRFEKQMVREMLDPLFDYFEERISQKGLVADLFYDWVSVLLREKMAWYVVERLEGYPSEVFDEILLLLESDLKVINLDLSAANLLPLMLEGEEMNAGSLHEILVLTGMVYEREKGDIESIHNRLFERVKKKPKDEKNKLTTILLDFAETRGDIYTFKKLSESLGGESKDYLKLSIELGTGDWESVDKRLSALYKDRKEEFITSNYFQWAIALEKLGKRKEAAEKMAEFELYALGDLRELNYAASELALHGVVEKSSEYYEQLLVKELMLGSNYMWLLSSVSFSYTPMTFSDNKKVMNAIASAHKYVGHLQAHKLQFFIPTTMLYVSNQAELRKGLLLLESDPELANKLLDRAVNTSKAGGRIADFYFPEVEKSGAMTAHKKAFEKIKNEMEPVIKLYPKSSHALNSYAWISAKAGYELDKAEAYSRASLKHEPGTSAYIDTLAETFFARGNREEAIRISESAIKQTLRGRAGTFNSIQASLSEYKSLMIQLNHFKNDPLPEYN